MFCFCRNKLINFLGELTLYFFFFTFSHTPDSNRLVRLNPAPLFLLQVRIQSYCINPANNQWTKTSPRPRFFSFFNNTFHLDVCQSKEEETCHYFYVKSLSKSLPLLTVCSHCYLGDTRFSVWFFLSVCLCYLCCIYSLCDLCAVGVVWSCHCRKTYSMTERIEKPFHRWFIFIIMINEKDKTGSKKDKRENNCELYHWPLKSSAKYWTKSLKFSSPPQKKP